MSTQPIDGALAGPERQSAPASVPAGPTVVLWTGSPAATLAAVRTGLGPGDFRVVAPAPASPEGGARLERGMRRLRRFFGDRRRVDLVVVPVAGLARGIALDGYARALLRHGLAALSPCLAAEVAFRASVMVHCLENEVRTVVDGVVGAIPGTPEPVEALLVPRVRSAFAACGIDYQTPVLDEGIRAGQILHELRFHRSPDVAGTREDLLLPREAEALHRMVLRACAPAVASGRFDDRAAALGRERYDRVETWVHEWLERREGSSLSRMLEQ